MAYSPSTKNHLFLYCLVLVCATLPALSAASIRTSVKLDPTGYEYINKACSYGSEETVDNLDCDLFLQAAPDQYKTSPQGFAYYTLTYAQNTLTNLTGEVESSLVRCPDEDLENDLRAFCVYDPTMVRSVASAIVNLDKKDYPNVTKMVEKALAKLEKCSGTIELLNFRKEVGFTNKAAKELKISLTITNKIVGAHFLS